MNPTRQITFLIGKHENWTTPRKTRTEKAPVKLERSVSAESGWRGPQRYKQRLDRDLGCAKVRFNLSREVERSKSGVERKGSDVAQAQHSQEALRGRGEGSRVA